MITERLLCSSKGLTYRRRGSGVPVVLIHGIPGSERSWDAVRTSLSVDLDVISPNLLGFGGSARPADAQLLLSEGQAEALADLLDELEITRAILVGHDFGGPVALQLTRRRPDTVSALGLLAANVFADTPVPFPLATARWPLVGFLARRLVFSTPSLRLMLKRGTGSPVTALDPETHLGEREQRETIAWIFATSLTRLAELYRPIEEQLRALRIPMFVGWGEDDPFFTVAQGERTAQAARVRLRLYDRAGHFLPQERPGEVAADIAALVKAAHA